MKNLFIALILSLFSFSTLAQTSPFSIFQGKYESQSCKCIGTGQDQFSYDPCNLQSIEIRSYKNDAGSVAWVLDEIFATEYTVRPLDEIAIKLMLGPGEVVSTDLHGNNNLAIVTFTSNKSGVSNYQIVRASGGFQYSGGFKGAGKNGSPVDLQCYHSLIKK